MMNTIINEDKITFRRHVYETKTEEGKKTYIYLLDQSIHMNKIGPVSYLSGEQKKGMAMWM